MTPDFKKEAELIFESMYYNSDPMGKYPMCYETAKQCSINSVKMILKSGALVKLQCGYLPLNTTHIEYWEGIG